MSSNSAESRSIFAKQMRSFRKKQSMTLKDLSAASGLSYHYLSAVENERANISLDNADKIASSLGVPLATLFIEHTRRDT